MNIAEIFEKPLGTNRVEAYRNGVSKIEAIINEIIKTNGLSENHDEDHGLTHHFAPGIYAREISIPAGGIVVGCIHKHSHLNMLSQGHVLVATEDGPVEYKAPFTFTSKPGVKRVFYAFEDSTFTTIHANPDNLEDIAELERLYIAETFDEYDDMRKDQ